MSDPNDMSGAEAATAREGKYTRKAREALHSEEPSAAEIGRAVADALQRQIANPIPNQQAHLGPVVRASVRAGYETERQVSSDGSARMVTRPKKYTFSAADTADGREWTVENGRPVRLKRDSFIRLRDQGVVIIAE